MFGYGGYGAPMVGAQAAAAPVATTSCCRPKCCWYTIPFFILLGLLGLAIPGGFFWIILLVLLFIIICVSTF